MRAAVLFLLLVLAGCASTPDNINNACSVFQQRDGWFNDWYSAAKRTERTYGVPVPVLMATIRVESGFKANARPPRKKLLGFIPWKRPSSAYGYSQALDGTWAEYKRATGKPMATRRSFADAVDFVGWYHYRSNQKNGIALNDTYNLYLAYYAGHGGYARGNFGSGTRRAAQKAAAMADSYARQIRSCGL
ncbi:transglycosylase SLT domain-containing protein [Chelativorans sp. M5D2P16]|uniref:transglycosylase SLT domain-containing protein n=1 Tax=Chelativorans sp. M5D2P16 TaxID=3095678 RepID=UPI002ACA62E3|nr:transglycosylase SLT domain-containing protein [Chelativorans sp. M5D2P16]MDZ5697102.1 transglycosylase SLT domain-containing protein [Chelativorans sp. M5D2P16]